MPTSYTIDAARNVVYTMFSGVTTDLDLFAHVSALQADPRFSPDMAELVDLSEITRADVTSSGIQSVARTPAHARTARRAFVAPTDVLFGLTRMYQSYWNDGAQDRLAIFRAREPALEWLGVSDALTGGR
jgi:hypothetical protein